MSIWIIAATTADIDNIVRAAGPEASILVVGKPQLAQALRGAKVKRIVHVDTDGQPAENYATSVADYLSDDGANVVLAADFPGERALATATAAKLGAAWLSSAVAFTTEGDTAEGRTGKAIRSVAALAEQELAITGPVALVLPTGEVPMGGAAEVETLELASFGIEILESRTIPSTTVDLSKVPRVIGVGRGIAEQEDLAMIDELAAKLGAKVGATRPLAEGYRWFPSYIGVTGQQLAADLYIAIGISGQVHHSAGIRESKVIVAINEDPQAPIFRDADYGIVGDLYEIVPKITEAL